ncbi:MAG: DUF2244 domain-containing protein [Sulfuriferula sp.]
MYGGIQITQAGAVDCCITARPNCSLSRPGKIFVLVSFFLILSIPAGVFTVMGAWPILPFAGLEMLVVLLAFYQISCHEHDYERITIAGNSLVLERRDNVRVERSEYNRCWAQVVLQCQSVGRQCHVALRSHGAEQELGRHLNDELRTELAHQLERRLGCQ